MLKLKNKFYGVRFVKLSLQINNGVKFKKKILTEQNL